MTGRPRVAVVVLAYNGCELTLACLESVLASDWPELQVIVVDNGSGDGTPAAVRSHTPTVTVVENGRNLGFPAGNNVGIRHALLAGADHVLLLNNDTTVAPDCIRLLVEAHAAGPVPRLLCPLIYYADPPDVVWYAGSTWDPEKIYNGGYRGRGQRDVGQFAGVHETGVATGAAMFIPRALFEAVGLLDEDLFLQGEDVEFSVRARRNGFATAVVSEARVWHHVSAASGGEHSPLIAYYMARNALCVSRRYRTSGRFRSALFELGFVSLCLAHARRADDVLENARAVLAGWRDYRAGRLGMRRFGAASIRRSRS
jgi:GT2 family glycosyltransferase